MITERQVVCGHRVIERVIMPCLKSYSMRIQNRMKIAYDKFHKVRNVAVRIGAIVYLRKPKKDSKYANPFTGPYLVTRFEDKSDSAYLQHVFTEKHLKRPVSLSDLKILSLDSVDELFNVNDNSFIDWEVTAILDHRESDQDGLEYLICWKDWPEPTWEPAHRVNNCDSLLKDYYMNC